MPTCPRCRYHFRTPEGEEQDHECPRCGYYPEPRGIEKSAKHIVNVSGGMASAVSLFRVIERFGMGDTLAVFADTNSEDADLYRFLDDVERVAGLPITRLHNDGLTIWDVFFRKAMLTTPLNGCIASWYLKKLPLRKFAEQHGPATDDLFDEAAIQYVGFDYDEHRRQNDLREAIKPRKVDFPLTWPPVLSRCDLAADLRARGIEPPRLYADGYPHNNCGGGCILAGIKQWCGLLRDNPALYQQHEDREQEFLAMLRDRGRVEITILKDRRGGEVKNLSLRQLREEIEAGTRTPTDTWRESSCQCMGKVFG